MQGDRVALAPGPTPSPGEGSPDSDAGREYDIRRHVGRASVTPGAGDRADGAVAAGKLRRFRQLRVRDSRGPGLPGDAPSGREDDVRPSCLRGRGSPGHGGVRARGPDTVPSVPEPSRGVGRATSAACRRASVFRRRRREGRPRRERARRLTLGVAPDRAFRGLTVRRHHQGQHARALRSARARGLASPQVGRGDVPVPVPVPVVLAGELGGDDARSSFGPRRRSRS